jgi:hypothetical protein
MSPRKKFSWMVFAVLVVSWSLIALWVMTDQVIFVALLLGWIFVGTGLVKSVKCPSCGMPLSYQGKISSFSVHGALARGRCRNCGYDLTAPDS